MKATLREGSESAHLTTLASVSLPGVRSAHCKDTQACQAHTYPEQEDWTFSVKYIHVFYKANLHQSTLQKTQYEICTVSSEYTKKYTSQETEYCTEVQLKTYIIHHIIL